MKNVVLSFLWLYQLCLFKFAEVSIFIQTIEPSIAF